MQYQSSHPMVKTAISSATVTAGLAASASPLWRARPRVQWQIDGARVVPWCWWRFFLKEFT